MDDARECHRRCNVIEGMREGLREREPRGSARPHKLSVLEEVGAAIGGPANDLSPVVETVFLERVSVFSNNVGLGYG